MDAEDIRAARDCAEIEADARRHKARVAERMLRRPHTRWLMRLSYRMFAWVEREARKEREILEGRCHD